MDIQISKGNVNEIKDAILSLIKNKEYLTLETQEYPLQIDFAGYRFTVSNKEEIENLIQKLQSKVCLWYKQ